MMQPPLEELKFEPLPQLAAALRAAKPRILARWHDDIVSLMPHADQLTRQQFENSLPELIEEAAAALQSAESGPTERLIQASPVHGTARYHQQFNFNELLIEYAVLRRVVLDELGRECSRPLDTTESIAVNEAIDVALRQAANAYAEHQAGQLRAEANALTKYLSFLSHDLRGGLNGVMLMIEVLRRDLAGDPKYFGSVEDLDGMRKSILDTVATMDRFLSAEKLRRGKMPVKLGPVNLRELFEELSRRHSVQPNPGQPIELKVNDHLVVQSDRELLSMILQNLLSNAIKYGGGEIVTLQAENPAGAPDVACRLTVIDRGPGIAPGQISLLFAPFVRGETYGQKGVGLGLFIARQSADLIGARLWAQSSPGEGSRFHVDLPRTPPRNEADGAIK